MKPAVIIPWRQGETELQTTIESATTSIGKGATIYPVEDTTRAGPARTRDRGIEAAAGADVVLLLDAHMIFEGDVLRRMARYVAQHGGLLCPKCYHNPECSFAGTHPSGASYYAGATIEYMGRDQNGQQALVWKWATDLTPGPRPCVGGGCYVFRRDWYMDAGRPLAALPGWGGDEEALSISAWLSGSEPRVFDGRVAHRWRPAAPWKLTGGEVDAIRRGSRAAIIAGVVADAKDAAELLEWQQARPATGAAVDRWRAAMLRQPRTWAQWKAAVPTRATRAAAASPAPSPRRYTANLTTPLHGVRCPHCHAQHDPKRLTVTHTYDNGNRRHVCPNCARPFISMYRPVSLSATT
jgi:hypothetical protein